MTTICQYYSFTSCSVQNEGEKKFCVFLTNLPPPSPAFCCVRFCMYLCMCFIQNYILPKQISSLSIFVFLKFVIEFSLIPFFHTLFSAHDVSFRIIHSCNLFIVVLSDSHARLSSYNCSWIFDRIQFSKLVVKRVVCVLFVKFAKKKI